MKESNNIDKDAIQIRQNAVFISFHVKTNSKFNEIKGNMQEIIIYTKSLPKKGKANKSIMKIISGKLEIPLNSIELVSGMKSVDKIVKITFLEKYETKYVLNKLLE